MKTQDIQSTTKSKMELTTTHTMDHRPTPTSRKNLTSTLGESQMINTDTGLVFQLPPTTIQDRHTQDRHTLTTLTLATLTTLLTTRVITTITPTTMPRIHATTMGILATMVTPPTLGTPTQMDIHTITTPQSSFQMRRLMTQSHKFLPFLRDGSWDL